MVGAWDSLPGVPVPGRVARAPFRANPGGREDATQLWLPKERPDNGRRRASSGAALEAERGPQGETDPLPAPLSPRPAARAVYFTAAVLGTFRC